MSDEEKRKCPFLVNRVTSVTDDDLTKIELEKFVECYDQTCMAWKNGRCLRLEPEYESQD